MLGEFCFWSSWLPYFAWLVHWAVSCFPKTQQGYTCGVDVGLVWCLGRRQGQMSVTGIPYPCKGTCGCWVAFLLWEGLSSFCFHLRACFIPPSSARERNLSPGKSHFLFYVGSADPEGRSLWTNCRINAVCVAAQFCLTFKCTLWAITGQSWGTREPWRSEVKNLNLLVCCFPCSPPPASTSPSMRLL